MTLFTKPECPLCDRLKNQFDLAVMQVNVEVLGTENADSLAHLAWHGLVETARKTLPLLVRDDSTTVDAFPDIENELAGRARQCGLGFHGAARGEAFCEDGRCTLH
jgi:hypothetical protein